MLPDCLVHLTGSHIILYRTPEQEATDTRVTGSPTNKCQTLCTHQQTVSLLRLHVREGDMSDKQTQ